MTRRPLSPHEQAALFAILLFTAGIAARLLGDRLVEAIGEWLVVGALVAAGASVAGYVAYRLRRYFR